MALDQTWIFKIGWFFFFQFEYFQRNVFLCHKIYFINKLFNLCSLCYVMYMSFIYRCKHFYNYNCLRSITDVPEAQKLCPAYYRYPTRSQTRQNFPRTVNSSPHPRLDFSHSLSKTCTDNSDT